MWTFSKRARRLPGSKDFALQSYTIDFFLDRLVPGVDNVRHDVSLSSAFVATVRKTIARNIVRQAGLENSEPAAPATNWAKEAEGFKHQYAELMRGAVNQAKGLREGQLVHLAHAAVWKLMHQEARSQFDLWVGHLKKQVRSLELTDHRDPTEGPRRKAQLQGVLQEREAILLRVGMELFGFMAEVEQKEIQPVFEANFGPRSSFLCDVLGSPMLHQEQLDNEFFRIDHYDISLGRRVEDPDKYESLLFLLRQLINQLDLSEPDSVSPRVDQRLAAPLDPEGSETNRQAYALRIESWLKEPGNINRLLNCGASRAELRALEKAAAEPALLAERREMARRRKRVRDFFFRAFSKLGLIERISASYEMQPEFLDYCPPLAPRQILDYLAMPRTRRAVRGRLKRLRKLYGRRFSLRPLNKKIKSMEHMTAARQKDYLVRFLSAFACYHRDACNLGVVRDAMERVRLVNEDKIRMLSRENNTLYEFLLPHETVSAKAPIINHVVIKADVRGSTDITHQMNARGLNPASYFSLNFFDPISELLTEYDASKIFLEGDAMIMSIFERENTPAGWYGVARACGLALNMLAIIRRYNEKNLSNRLPALELGIGVSYMDQAPTFLFDGSHRIMISPAINLADRLSGCSRTGRKLASAEKGPFNLYVFQTVPDEALASTQDDLFIRYNVNGIELNPEGFEKLSREIDLKPVELKPVEAVNGPRRSSTIRFYTGIFPTKGGRYHRLIIREALIPVVDPATLKTLHLSSRKYYEVCARPELEKMLRPLPDGRV